MRPSLPGPVFKVFPVVFSAVIRSLVNQYLIYLVLSTQAMLGTLMSGSGDESEGAFNKSTAAATINWILKDGLGQAGGIALIALLGSKLDSHARSLRFHSSLLCLAGSALEFSIPAFCDHFGMAAFLPVASVANVAKNVSWMLASATRAHFMRQMALKGNLGDLTGKAASQMTLATLFGTAAGLAVLKVDTWPWLLGSWSVASIVTAISGYQSCRIAVSRQLNPQRLANLLQNKLCSPEALSAREPIVFSKSNLPKLHCNPPLTILAELKGSWLASIENINFYKYAIFKDSQNEYYIWTTNETDSSQKLSAILQAFSDHFYVTISDGKVNELERLGWDVKHFSHPPLEVNTLNCLE